ncbi:MAG: YtxH domain-containing protein [Candidatus Omnitrophota bacterium]
MCHERHGGSCFWAFMAGAAMGAGMALLFAPRSGRETRQKIKDMSEKVVDNVKDAADKAADQVKSFFEGAKREAEKIEEDIEREVKPGVERSAEEMKRQMEGKGNM